MATRISAASIRRGWKCSARKADRLLRGDLHKGRYLVNFPYAYYRLNGMLKTAHGGQ